MPIEFAKHDHTLAATVLATLQEEKEGMLTSYEIAESVSDSFGYTTSQEVQALLDAPTAAFDSIVQTNKLTLHTRTLAGIQYYYVKHLENA